MGNAKMGGMQFRPQALPYPTPPSGCFWHLPLLPSLHLKESNLATKFCHAGFPENRSKFLTQLNENNAYMGFGREILNVEGKEGEFV